MEITTVGELLHWSYANLAMAHSAIEAKADNYGRIQFMIRSRLYKGLNLQTMKIGPLAATAQAATTYRWTISFPQSVAEPTLATT